MGDVYSWKPVTEFTDCLFVFAASGEIQAKTEYAFRYCATSQAVEIDEWKDSNFVFENPWQPKIYW